ncbi:MAG: hypothetical protein WC362_05470 [Methanoregula sp.]|jgi:hypothetical protein
MASNKNHVYVYDREMVPCGRNSTKTRKDQRALMGGAVFSPPPIKASGTFDSIASSGVKNPAGYPDSYYTADQYIKVWIS